MPNNVTSMENKKPERTALAVLLGADRGKVKLIPKRQMEITRLSEAAGEPVIFTVRGLTPEEHAEAQEASMSISKRGELDEMDSHEFQRRVVQAGLIDPPLGDEKLLEAFGASTPDKLLLGGDFLMVGELAQLQNAILECSGFGESAVKQVKNS